MGGTAFLIHGDLEPSRIDSGPWQKTLTEKLLSCFGVQKQKQVSDFDSFTLTDLPPGGLVRLVPAFKIFLAQQFITPWPATKTCLDYLNPTVYLRGEKRAEEDKTNWYVQLSFSSSAGTTEVTSELVYHWAEIWIKHKFQELNETILKPEGFTAKLELVEVAENSVTFVPVGGKNNSIYAAATFAETGVPEFELDECVCEFREDGGEELLDEIRSQLWELMVDGQCRCQLCMPDYQPIDSIAL